MSLAQYRPLGFGEILDGAFSLYRRNFFTFFLTALLLAAPMSLASGYFVRQTMDDPGAAPGLAFVVAMLVGAVALLMQWGALTRHVSQAYTGAPVRLGDGLRAGLRALLPLLAVAVLAYVALFAVLMVVIIPLTMIMVFTGAMSADPGVGAMVIGGVVVLLTMVVMLVAVSALFGVVPAVVVERCGPIAAMLRSFRLSRGALLRIAGIVVVGWIIAILPMVGVSALTGSLVQVFTGQPPASTGAFYFQQVFGLLGSALTTPFWVGSLVMAYYDRRVRTEAFDLQVAADALAPA